MAEETDNKAEGKMAEKAKAPKKQESWGEFARTMGWALLIALVVRSLMFQPFNIPSSSMKPTLLIGDFLFVSKYSYGYSKHSFPFSPPLFSGRTSDARPVRGDVVVFKLPYDNRTDFIKRVIGLPGDTIRMQDGQVILNGKALPRERVDDFVEVDRQGREKRTPRYLETLPNGRSYMTLDELPDGPADNTGVYRVPAGHYFLMGDNRDNSTDSRVQRYVGFVPYENLVGPARVLFFSFNDTTRLWEVWRWPIAIRYGRLFDVVR